MTNKEIFQKIAAETGQNEGKIMNIYYNKYNNEQIEKLLKKYFPDWQAKKKLKKIILKERKTKEIKLIPEKIKKKIKKGLCTKVAEKINYTAEHIRRISRNEHSNYKIEKCLEEERQIQEKAERERLMIVQSMKNFRFGYGSIAKIAKEFSISAKYCTEVKQGKGRNPEILKSIYKEYIRQISEKVKNFMNENR
jgi:hypothetical protein